MASPPDHFSLRALGNGSSTVEQIRQALSHGPADQLVLLQSEGAPVRFPALCPNCEQPARHPLRIERSFILYVYNGSDSPNYSVPSIQSFDVPFCEACSRQHSSQEVLPGPWTPLLRIVSEAEGFAGLVVIAISGLFFSSALRNLSLVAFLLGCFPLFVGLSLIRPIWQKSRHMSLPRPSEVSLSIDFSAILSLEHEPAWRAFYFRSAHYASQFRQLNTAQIWNPQSQIGRAAAAQRAAESNRNTWIVGGVVVALLLWLALSGRI